MNNIINSLSIMVIAILMLILYQLFGHPLFLFQSGVTTGIDMANLINDFIVKRGE